uniref:Putative nonstructural protein n=1 Tax=Hymenopteran phasma-related virus OKIAV233 TaxID=2792587 RepID=A0A7T0M3N4_9VIRU|nr:putative nonstructural protein [Hymenopteran phasma-related virus OKIAV233]
MYFPISIIIKQIENNLDIRIEKGDIAEFIIDRSICSCGFMFKLPLVHREGIVFTYKSLYQTNFQGLHSYSFTLPAVNGSSQVVIALQQFEGSYIELQHIFEYSLFNYTNFFNLNKQYDYSCSYGNL